jgi:hypothetical protein
MIACTPARAAPRSSFSPNLRATIAVVDIADDLEDRLGQADRCQRLRAQPGHEERIHHGEDRLAHHLEDHGYG